jgi:flagellar hook-basal body complex protein FliE
MNVSPVSSATAAVPTQGVGTRQEKPVVPAGSGASAFGQVMTQFLNDAASQQAHAETSVTNLAAGRADNVHNVMLAMAKADLSFHLVLEIRNRLSEAYQEIMRMQI